MPTPNLTRSAKLYQERRQPEHRNTRRHPGPHHDFGMNAAHRVPQRPPYPTISILQSQNDNEPDAGRTTPWPWGVEGEQEIV
jgi:hypothetical protein